MAGHSHKQISAAEQKAKGKAAMRQARSSGQESLSRNSSQTIAHYARKRKRARRVSFAKHFFITLCTVLLVCVGVAWAYIANINNKITGGVNSALKAVLTETQYKEPFYMLLLGVDKDEARASGTEYGADDSAYRTDTIILARIDPTNLKVTLISIPRDLQVDMGQHGQQKINAAYTYGGSAYSVEVVSQLAGVDISHVATIDMDGFAQVVDAVGGVDVDLPVPVKDPKYTGLDLPAGEQHLDGHTAALLGRTRHAYDEYGGGDFYRGANQRMLIGAVMRKLLASDPITMASTINTAAGFVKTDMSVSDIIGLATQFIGFDVDSSLYSGAAPTESVYQNNLWYEILKTSEWKTIMSRVDQGLPPYTDASEDSTAGVAASIGVSSGGEESTDSSSTTAAEYSGNVLVLNGSGVNGAAGNAANTLTKAGFSTATGNADPTAETTVYYNASSEAKAKGVIEKLGLHVSPVKNSGEVSDTQDVVVVLGSDFSL